MSVTTSNSALRSQLWWKEVFKDVEDNLYFMQNGLMGKGENQVVQMIDDLSKMKGDRITVPLSAKLGKTAGVAGGSELEGNETKVNYYSEDILIDQFRTAIRLNGLLDEQKNAFDMRSDAKKKLSIRIQEFIEQQIFLKLAGVTNTSLTDVNGESLGTLDDGSALCTWSNTPDYIPDADTAAGYGDRYLGADYTNGATSLAATDLLTPDLISRAKRKAELASPKIKPLRINGRSHYVMFVHPWQAYDLKNNAVWAQAQREANIRGADNPIFTDMLGVWDGVIVKQHEYVPFLDVSVAGNSFRGSASGTDFAVDACRALLCGQQAAIFAKSKMNVGGWVEKKFDYDDQTGFASGFIGGIQKTMFNSKEYGCIAVDTAVTALV